MARAREVKNDETRMVDERKKERKSGRNRPPVETGTRQGRIWNGTRAVLCNPYFVALHMSNPPSFFPTAALVRAPSRSPYPHSPSHRIMPQLASVQASSPCSACTPSTSSKSSSRCPLQNPPPASESKYGTPSAPYRQSRAGEVSTAALAPTSQATPPVGVLTFSCPSMSVSRKPSRCSPPPSFQLQHAQETRLGGRPKLPPVPRCLPFLCRSSKFASYFCPMPSNVSSRARQVPQLLS